MASSTSKNPDIKTPILLLKTKSTPHDGYDELFSTTTTTTTTTPATRTYNPTFIPVLEHQFHAENLTHLKSLFESGSLNPSPHRKYGGIIFTSQRAVEAFSSLVKEIEESITSAASESLLLYTVGPATARSLKTLCDAHLPHAKIFGAEAGTGENLASFILDHYNGVYSETAGQGVGGAPKPPLLFLVGEQRRDVIPRTLRGASVPAARIEVDEVVVYRTGVVEGFEGDFEGAVRRGRRGLDDGLGGTMWVVVFSPTGCDAMLRVLKREDGDGGRRVFVATIGPTTRDHLLEVYGFEPEVCAKKPSPEGVWGGIDEFMKEWENGRDI